MNDQQSGFRHQWKKGSKRRWAQMQLPGPQFDYQAAPLAAGPYFQQQPPALPVGQGSYPLQTSFSQPGVRRPKTPRAPHNTNNYLLQEKQEKRRKPGRRGAKRRAAFTPDPVTPVSTRSRSESRRGVVINGTKIDEYGTAGGLLEPTDTDSDDDRLGEGMFTSPAEKARTQQLELENESLRKEVDQLRRQVAALENSTASAQNSPTTTQATPS